VAGEVSPQVRVEVARRADHRCEYCLVHEADAGFPHQIDHIVGRKHGGPSSLDNLAYACILCNRYKGSDIASMTLLNREVIPLFHPRRDRWVDHFRLDSEHNANFRGGERNGAALATECTGEINRAPAAANLRYLPGSIVRDYLVGA